MMADFVYSCFSDGKKANRLKQPIKIYDEADGGGSTTGTLDEFNREEPSHKYLFLLSLAFVALHLACACPSGSAG